jgi:hypothetical protein
MDTGTNMSDPILITVDGETREATEQEAANIREAQANAQTHTADSPSS